jgi:nucleotide-binding universal stress UspA family protein
MAGPIVVGVGAGSSGNAAALTAARVANLMNVPLILVFGYESSALAPRGGALTDEIEAIGEEATSDARSAISEQYPSLEVQVELVQDRPVESLIRVAEAREAEAIVVGHGGAGPLKAALLGSITYEMVHRAPIPVLVVPEPDDEDDE